MVIGTTIQPITVVAVEIILHPGSINYGKVPTVHSTLSDSPFKRTHWTHWQHVDGEGRSLGGS